MGNHFGSRLSINIFGQSHSDAIGVTIEGLPAGFSIDTDELSGFLKRRAPGQSELTTARKETDAYEIICGVCDPAYAPGETASAGDIPDESVSGEAASSKVASAETGSVVTCGAPLTVLIRNSDQHSKDYSNIKDMPRPGHADYTASVKYDSYNDIRGGGQFSGRLTAPLCIAGGIVKQLLKKQGIDIYSHIYSIKDIKDTPYPLTGPFEDVSEKELPVMDNNVIEPMKQLISKAKADLDSVGGIIECAVCGVGAGFGEPMFGGVENVISQAVFAIPAVKGIEFGRGFEAAALFGSENNDSFIIRNDRICTETNNHGGSLGGITSGMPIVFRAAFKPTPSIARPQKSVSLSKMEEGILEIKGRHDPCIVLRALPCVEAAAALAVWELMG
ncbi:MAG: chorismate synthase [Lachnospiraceae bacterium]|nr:chorismate synthase [Lachnospiraceae bacterium]